MAYKNNKRNILCCFKLKPFLKETLKKILLNALKKILDGEYKILFIRKFITNILLKN